MFEQVKVGSEFTRLDKNGVKWVATVTKRTPQFVDVKVIRPYKVKFCLDGIGVKFREDEVDFTARVILRDAYDEVETGNVVQSSFGFGAYPEKKRVLKYIFIELEDLYARHLGVKVYKLEE